MKYPLTPSLSPMGRGEKGGEKERMRGREYLKIFSYY